MSSSAHKPTANPFKQPGAVWAVAFACVVSFMGIGLVDPILPTLADQLNATPTQVSLLFTSYLMVTAVAMLGVGWVASRIGGKPTLIVGLIIIVIFAALAGTSDTIGGLVGFRAGWGVGNALFIATSLAVIVASASGGFGGAIILYEAALGIGIAVGPLLGGILGDISWRGPFYGVAALMTIALIATMLFVQKIPQPKERVRLSAPLAALKHRGLLTMSVMALLYNWGFFTMLGYAPYPMKLGAIHLGLVFTGWGVLVALFSVFFAPRLQGRFGTAAVLYVNMAALAVIMAVIAFGVNTPTVVIVAVIVSGACIGINNTLTTQAVMLVAPVERSVASSAYGFVRFIGGGLAPFVAGKIAEATSPGVAFAVGGLAFLLAIAVLASGHESIRAAENAPEQTEVLPQLESVGAAPQYSARPVLVAVGTDVDTDVDTDEILDRAADLAIREGAPLEIVHVRETDIVSDESVEVESRDHALAAVSAHLHRVADRGLAVHATILHTIGDHQSAGRALRQYADRVDARTVMIGRSAHGTLGRLIEGSFRSGAVERSTRLQLID